MNMPYNLLTPYQPPQHKFDPLFWLLILATILILIGIARADSPPATLTASWYDLASLKKEGTYKYSKGRMANGKIFDENSFTCASWDFPLKTKLKVTNVKEPKKSVIVEVTDRTNKRFKGKRIDLSKRAFAQIADLKQGIIKIKVERRN